MKFASRSRRRRASCPSYMLQIDGGRTEEEPCYGELFDFCQSTDLQAWLLEIQNIESLIRERVQIGLSAGDQARLEDFETALEDWETGVFYLPGSCEDLSYLPEISSAGPPTESCAQKAVVVAKTGRCFLEQWQGPPQGPQQAPTTQPGPAGSKGKGGNGADLVKTSKNGSPWGLALIGAILAIPFFLKR